MPFTSEEFAEHAKRMSQEKNMICSADQAVQARVLTMAAAMIGYGLLRIAEALDKQNALSVERMTREDEDRKK